MGNKKDQRACSMASIYRRPDRPGGVWWAKYYHPSTFEPLRDSLNTTDEARAKLLLRRLDLEIELARPEIGSVGIPDKIRERIGITVPVIPPTPVLQTTPASPIEAPAITPKAAARNAPVPEAIKRYHSFIKSDNDDHHVAGKLSILRAFFGTASIDEALGQRCRNKVVGYYLQPTIGGISGIVLQDFFEKLERGDSTKRHYREVLHHFLEKMIDFEIYTPPSIHRPNPVATLPSFETRNDVITYLTPENIAEQRAALAGNAPILIAVDIMIEAGLRREEALGLRREDIVRDTRQLNVAWYVDPKSGKVRKLKTGCRKIPISPSLRAKLIGHLASLEGDWLIPGPGGNRWTGDYFSKTLATLNAKAGIHWTCHEYRHTYATCLASNGASLLKIARRLGDTIQTAAKYYTQFVDEELD